MNHLKEYNFNPSVLLQLKGERTLPFVSKFDIGTPRAIARLNVAFISFEGKVHSAKRKLAFTLDQSSLPPYSVEALTRQTAARINETQRVSYKRDWWIDECI